MTEEELQAMREDAAEHADILSGKNTIPVDQVKALLAEYGERCVEQVPLVLAEVERLRAGYERVIDAIQTARSNNRLIRPFDERVDNALIYIIDVAREGSEGNR